MSKFLEEFDEAITAARLHKTTGKVWRLEECPEGSRYPVARLAARTMHPSFMQPKVPKHNPERDQ